MKQCKCEHWQQCPTCMPHRFDTEGNRLPPEPTPLQAAKAEIESLKQRLFEMQNAAIDLAKHSGNRAEEKMSREEITRMARGAGFVGFDGSNKMLRKFAALVAAAEREAVIAIVNDNSDSDGLCCTDDLLAAIRARGNK